MTLGNGCVWLTSCKREGTVTGADVQPTPGVKRVEAAPHASRIFSHRSLSPGVTRNELEIFSRYSASTRSDTLIS
jgi:hypothetical protein